MIQMPVVRYSCIHTLHTKAPGHAKDACTGTNGRYIKALRSQCNAPASKTLGVSAHASWQLMSAASQIPGLEYVYMQPMHDVTQPICKQDSAIPGTTFTRLQTDMGTETQNPVT